MNKSLLTNFIALLLFFIGYQFNNTILFHAGLFAFSGAITNWLAVHMLFEKVPGLYGSGIIPARFNEFKLAIKVLMMEQFFTDSNINRFLNQSSSLDIKPIIQAVNFDSAFNSLVQVIMESSFGGMLSMFGGKEALTPLKEPFIETMEASLVEISQSDSVKQALKSQFESTDVKVEIRENIEDIIDQRLNELTPILIKDMIQNMIKEHLGWLVIWGGFFGGLIGVISSFLRQIQS